MELSPAEASAVIVLIAIGYHRKKGTQSATHRKPSTMKRHCFTPTSHHMLEAIFRVDTYPSYDVRRLLATQFGLSVECITNWFQNRRAKQRRHNQTNMQDFYH